MAASNLNTRREKLIEALAVGATITSAAKRAGYSKRQALRLTATDEFKADVRKAREAITGQASGLLAASTAKAIARLNKLLGDDDHAVARRAAKDLLEMHLRFQQQHDLTEELRQIKESLATTIGDEGDEH
jgi:phage terminase small subunit